jgi:ATP-binding cassette subfamily B protein
MVPYRKQFLLAGVALLTASLSALLVPYGAHRMIDAGFLQGAGNSSNATGHNLVFLMLFALSIVLGVATAARFYLVSWLGERIVADLRNALYGHAVVQSPEFFETAKTGEVLSRLTTDTTLIQAMVGTSVSVAARNLVLLIGGAIGMFLSSALLSTLILLMLVLGSLPMAMFGRRVRRLSHDSQHRIADAAAVAAEVLNAAPTVQAYTHERAEMTRFAESIEKAFAAALRRIKARSLMTLAAIVLTSSATLIVVWLGAETVKRGNINVGELTQFILYAVIVSNAISALSEVSGDFQRAAGATERLLDLIALHSPISSPVQPKVLPVNSFAGVHVSFRNVAFHYPSRPGMQSLQHINLDVAPGEKIAIVGASGAGKTTIFQLLLRFYDPQQGEILIDGENIRDLDLSALRETIGVVLQETVIFSADVMENIRYGREDASDEEVIAAARMAAVHEFVAPLPDGYHTFLGERGVRLSGGQKQRIAIARALLKDPRLLLLDEATSALDAESERYVQQALAAAVKGRTTLIIAHRLATVQKADRIIVMDNGCIVESGTHAALLAQGGRYARHASLQFEDHEQMKLA